MERKPLEVLELQLSDLEHDIAALPCVWVPWEREAAIHLIEARACTVLTQGGAARLMELVKAARARGEL